MKAYSARVHYTPGELLEAEINDLETDVRCALRDGYPDYAKECELKRDAKIAELKAIRAKNLNS